MHYLLFYDVVSDYVERRAAYRAEHLALAKNAVARGDLVLGGALGEPVDQSVLLFSGDSPAAAEAFAKADPYGTNGHQVARSTVDDSRGPRCGGQGDMSRR